MVIVTISHNPNRSEQFPHFEGSALSCRKKILLIGLSSSAQSEHLISPFDLFWAGIVTVIRKLVIAALMDGSLLYSINHFPLKVVAEKSQNLSHPSGNGLDPQDFGAFISASLLIQSNEHGRIKFDPFPSRIPLVVLGRSVARKNNVTFNAI